MPIVALTSEFAVNTSTALDQAGSATAGFPGGGFIVTWVTRDTTKDGSDEAVMAQRFAADGSKTGPEFVVNTQGTSYQSGPVAATFADGGFVIAWVTSDATQDGSGNAIKAQLYDASGARVGGEFLANSSTAFSQFTPNVTVLAKGNFVISWDDWSSFDMRAQIFTQGGAKVGAELLVNVRPDYFQEYGDIAALEGGGFVATWRTTNPDDDGSDYAIKGRVFSASGVGGPEFLVNSIATGYQLSSVAAGLTGGGFVIAWSTSDASQDGSSGAIKAQRFDAAGVKIGGEFLVNSQTFDMQSSPAVAALPDGRFVISWNTMDPAQDGSGMAIKAQAFAADGSRIGGEFLVNTIAAGHQSDPDISALSYGKFLISWTSATGDGSGAAVRARLFSAAVPPVFSSASEATILEHRAIVTAVAASDPDGAPVSFAITSGADAALFAIDAATGALRFIAAPDFEAPADADGDNVYQVIVTASDGTMSASQALALTVADVDEVRTGSDGRDVFMLNEPGNFEAYGQGGVDSFYFGAAFGAGDFVDGGADRDSLLLQGDYVLTFANRGESNIVGIEGLSLLSGSNTSFGDSGGNLYSYDLTFVDANVSAGSLMKVNGFYLLAGENLSLDASAETDASLQILAGLGVDRLVGGTLGDAFVFGHDARFGAGDTVDGGGGYDVVYLRGDYAIDFDAAGFAGALTNVESIALLTSANTEFAGGGDGDFDYSIVWSDFLLAAGATMTVNGSRLQSHETFTFDGSRETDGHLRLFGGMADDDLTGGGGDDQLHGGGGSDRLTGGAGADLFRYSAATDSTGTAVDEIFGFTPGEDRIDLGRIDARLATEDNEAFAFIGSEAFSAAGPDGPGEVRIAYVADDLWAVEADVDGDGIADLSIQVHVAGDAALTGADFVL